MANRPSERQAFQAGLDNQDEASMKFPRRLRHKGQGKVWARIYKSKNTGRFVLYWRADVNGKRKQLLKEFRLYSEALKFGKQKVTELATGKLSSTLSPTQIANAVAAFTRLQAFKRSHRQAPDAA
jgi:hypothetical protein